jgi:hypothetical protein
VEQYDWIRADDVAQSHFDLEVLVLVPEDFWDEDPEPPYLHPEQKHFWREAVPERRGWRVAWLDDLHDELIRLGWPPQTISAIYSYFEAPLTNPDEGERLEQGMSPAATFRVSIDGDWLIRHPTFFQDAKKLEKKISIKTKEKKRPYQLWIERITARNGPLDGEFWENPRIKIRPSGAPKAFEGGPRDWYPGIE